MFYFPLIDKIVELIKSLHPKHQLKVPENPKKSRVMLVAIITIILTVGMAIGTIKLIGFVLLSANYQLILFSLGILFLALGWLMIQKPIDNNYARKWWLGEASWWR